ncbi:MAG: hypothetical protein P4L16_02915 [Chlamydiales bacterium]|nr:hypothetical protein [Chlamydiales bacterium]
MARAEKSKEPRKLPKALKKAQKMEKKNLKNLQGGGGLTSSISNPVNASQDFENY